MFSGFTVLLLSTIFIFIKLSAQESNNTTNFTSVGAVNEEANATLPAVTSTVALVISEGVTGIGTSYAAAAVTSTVPEIRRKWRITICAMLRDEIPYLLEWIEFHRLQGVDHFVFYDDGSLDDTFLVPLLYKAHGLPDLVEIFPANFNRQNRPTSHDYHDYIGAQTQALQHCNVRLINKTHWVLANDVDEFVFSTTHESVWEFLESHKNLTSPAPGNGTRLVSSFHAQAIRFGTSGFVNDINGSIEADWATGTVAAKLEPINGSTPLIIVENHARAPHRDIDKDFQLRYNNVCANFSHESSCAHNNGKSIWIPERCHLAGVHWCENLTGELYWADVKDLRMNHLTIRSVEHVRNLIPFLRPWKEKLLGLLDTQWFSSLEDQSIQKFVQKVRKNLEILTKPS